jgi:hypothetical protein
MPTRPAQILSLLNQRQTEFHAFDEKLLQGLQAYRQAVQHLDIVQDPIRLFQEPLDHFREGRFVWPVQWQNREESLAWVRQHLNGITTFAVDGSQIYPSKDLSLPVALIQIGWFENFHDPQGRYEKDIRLDILSPQQLRDSSGGQSEEGSDRLVNMRRFQMETTRMQEYMAAHVGDPHCIIFMDGSLVGTFAQSFDGEMRRFYTDCLRQLVQSSEDYQVPLVAYVDTSYARDLTEGLQRWFQLPEIRGIHDAQILQPLMGWGDRTPVLRCERPILRDYYDEQQHRIGYLYLKTHEGYPARLELPLWIVESGRLETVLGWVRGEVIIGGGYPYVIETADQVAVLQAEDRYAFYRILQDWAQQQEIHLRLSRKMISKVRRR